MAEETTTSSRGGSMGRGFTPSKTERYLSKDLGDEFLFYDTDGEKIHVLNETAREIYLLCDGEHGVDQMVEALVARYEIDAESARRDVLAVLDDLAELGLVKDTADRRRMA
jgi:hypothetical protein